MIILIDKKYPLMVMKIYSFEYNDYNTFIKNMEYIKNKSENDDIDVKLCIDLYDLDSYSPYYLAELMKYLTGKSYEKLNNVKIYLNKENTNYVLKATAYINNNISKIIEIVELENKIIWSPKQKI